RGGAECRCVSRTWRVSVEEIILRALPPMPSGSLAALLVPGRLYFVLLSCRYLEQHEHAAATAYAAVASRAELNLSAATADEGKPNSASCTRGKYGDFLCYRIALRRIVQEALDSPAFSWCSSLGLDDSRLLEGCVGASPLLHSRWFSK
ncbi:unnamed protein product, partial [Scytosiphon promiscuus]